MALPDRFSLLVLGQGTTGLDIVRWALDHTDRVGEVVVYGGASSGANDATRALEEAGARFVYGTEDVEGSFDVCVASPGISEFSDFFAAARNHAGEIMGEPEFAYRLTPERWVGITGTNGKTTTTALTNHLLHAAGMRSSAVGNIGDTAISRVDGRGEGEWFVAELSSYQLATTSELHPRVAVLLNITPDHLAWHRSHENYARAKCRLFANLTPSDLAVVDVEDEGVRDHMGLIAGDGRRVLSLALDDPATADAAFVREGVLVVRLAGEETPLVAVDDLKIAGRHNLTNALAAASAALFAGASVEGVCAGLRSFAPLEHRIEPCGELDGVRFVNDSKATNTDAVIKALTAFPRERVVLLVGGHDKGTPLEEFARSVISSTVRAVVCFGEARERFLAAFLEADDTHELDLAEADNLRDAVDVARNLAERGEVVLLSPACSSFDEFSGFEERGRAYKGYLDELRGTSAAGR